MPLRILVFLLAHRAFCLDASPESRAAFWPALPRRAGLVQAMVP
jgi:hypothetical protein